MEPWKRLLLLIVQIINMGLAACTEEASDIKLCLDSTNRNFDESLFSVIPIRRNFEVKYGNIKNRGLRMHFYGKKQCPKTGYHKLAYKSLCPSYAVWNYDPDRSPQMITEMKCSCTKCLSQHEMYRHSCQAIYYYRYVLRKNSLKSCYYRTVEKYSVGCQCLGSSIDDPYKSKKVRQ